jgi:hypothetical protein
MEQTSCDMLEYDGELADGGGILDPLEVVAFVVVDVVVFVCPSLLFVVVLVLSYPPVIFVLLPDVFVCVFVSSESTGLAKNAVVNNMSNNNKFLI